MAKPIPYDDDPPETDERDMRKIAVYDDEALKMMQGWTGGQDDPLYAISSTGGWNYAWVFTDAIANIDMDLRKVKKLGRGKFQLGKGTFTKKEIDELRYIRDALQMALDDPESELVDEVREHRVADFNTLEHLVEHAAHELGATHVSGAGPQTKIYFPRGGQHSHEAASVRRKGGYWHADGPGARTGVARLPAGARPIAGHGGRRAAEAPRVPGAAHGLEWHRYREGFVGTIDGERRFLLDPTADGDWILWHVNSKTGAQDRKLGRFGTAADAKDAARSGVKAHTTEAKRTKADPRAVAFFRKHAGGVVGREDEYARDLAHAEQEATARGWAVEWHDDPEGWDSLGDIDPETVKEVLYAVIKDENGKVLGSLGSIVDPDRSYGRVVEAELALEALSEAGAGEARPRPKAKRSARRRR